MSINARTAALAALGQSLWLDNIRRGMLDGELQRLRDELGITGLTANPTIFEKAIAGSSDYDGALALLSQDAALGPEAAYERLAISDIQRAADILRPVYERTDGRDGFVSLEVSPELAHDTVGTLAEVRRFWAALERPNALIKIPGTPEGVPAIREALTLGINVNVTLLFSIAQYEAVALAYQDALEARLAAGQPVVRVASVASFFVSRVDTWINKLIDAAVDQKKPEARILAGLRGRLGIANSRLAYQKYLELAHGPRGQALASRGARPQRVLWASTSSKDPKDRDVRYVEALAGAETVNTLPPETLAAFADHGEAVPLLTTDLDEARAELARFEEAGLSLEGICRDLQREGVAKFTDSIVALRKAVAGKLDRIRREARPAEPVGATAFALGPLADLVAARLEGVGRDRLVQRLWDRDATLWKADPKHQAVVNHRLGWLEVALAMWAELPRLNSFVERARKAGFRHAVLLGMGGSSLAPEVFRRTFGVRSGSLDLTVLDSTSPDEIRSVEARLDLQRTLFLVSSKSGGTLETLSFFHYFHDRLRAALGPEAVLGDRFAAITDPGSGLERLARENGFGEIFLNPSDIGGRYSALSFFGIVPAALCGVEVSRILEGAVAMARASGPATPPAKNPSLQLGVALAEGARAGRNKLTLIAPPELASFGAWAEQLIAESTGKEGKGIVPIDGEPLGAATVYGTDRLFAELRLVGASPRSPAPPGPSVAVELQGLEALGGEFFRWEFATAVAGALLEIDPFDEPNVKESKDNTARILAEGDADAGESPRWQGEGLRIFGAKGLPEEPVALWRAFLGGRSTNGYVALQAYLAPSDRIWAELLQLRLLIRDRLRVATTVGYGPRFLHSTGQLHKGGPQVGTFVQLTADPGARLAIPGAPFDFGQLINAQAAGDLHALRQRSDRVLRCDLGADPLGGLAKLRAALEKALSA